MNSILSRAIGLVLILFALMPNPARSDEATAPGWYHADDVRWTIQHLAILEGPTADCSEPGSCQGASAPSKECIATYNRLYEAGKDNLDFRIFIGYWDTQPEPGAPRQDAVIDRYVKGLFTEILLKPCVQGLHACGFARDAERLSKEILGPDGKHRTIHLTLESSSVSDSDRENRHEFKSEQKAQSAEVQNDFLSALGTADVVLYTGHSRWGSGPGYKPLPMLSWSMIDAGLFKPSLHQFEKALKVSSEKPSVIGIFSCTSDKYYAKVLQSNAPDAGLALTTDAPSDMAAHEATLGTLNALLGMQCEDDFRNSLPEAEMLGFFKL